MHKHPEKRRIVEGVWFELTPKETNQYHLDDDCRRRLVRLGLKDRKAFSLARRLRPSHLREVLDRVERKVAENSDIGSPGGYTIRSLMNAYDEEPTAPFQEEEEDSKSDQLDDRRKEERIEALRKEFSEYQREAIEKAEAKVSERDRGDLEQRFIQSLSEEGGTEWRFFQERGFEDALIRTKYREFQVKHLLSESDQCFDQWRRDR
jgi:hypothetical protein